MTTYVHYGSGHFEPAAFIPVRNAGPWRVVGDKNRLMGLACGQAERMMNGAGKPGAGERIIASIGSRIPSALRCRMPTFWNLLIQTN